ncbi:TetR/AcrR family transcriptional regulator, partial [Aldersonia sp. NBC_00410]|nr:TetR/AcrR family transcriptional regulator [Aldersonia sp. NBC_00410]
RYLDQFLDDIKEADTVADRVVVGFVASIRAIGGNPLIGGLLETELTLVVGSIIKKDSGMLSTVQEFVAGQLRREQQVGNISGDVDADLVAEMMVRISASFLTVPSRIVDITDDVQLATVARKFLVPMLAAPPAG